jgi:hypothetical protein
MTVRIGVSVALTLLALSSAAAAPEIALPLADLSHIHGIEFDPGDGSALLATHHGIFRFERGGPAVLISPDRADYMGFTLTSAGAAIASGHPESGGNIGVVTSPDLGVTWTKLSDGADGPVDFHAIADASNNPAILIGLYQGGIQASTDGGKTWGWSGDAPFETFDLALAPDGGELFAATAQGVRISEDGGRSWTAIAGDIAAPTSLVSVFGDELYAYAVGQGLLVRRLSEGNWRVLAPHMGRVVPLHLAQDAANDKRLVAVTQDSAVLESLDGGGSWSPLE